MSIKIMHVINVVSWSSGPCLANLFSLAIGDLISRRLNPSS